MAQKFHIKRNDAVVVIAGAHKGKHRRASGGGDGGGQ